MVTKARSPNYPAFGLGKAIDLVRKVHGSINHHKAPALVVVKAIGYTSMNGKSLSAISALKKYGLLEDVGKEFKVSKDALSILFEPTGSPARTSALEHAAFAPDLFAKLRIEFPGALPSDELVRSYLLQNGFLLTTVDQAIRAYRDTMELVSDISTSYNENDEKSTEKSSNGASIDSAIGQEPSIEIGDLVQWETGGVLRMEQPQLVRAIQEHNGKVWAFVEGSETGILMEELMLEKKGVEAPPAAPPKLVLPQAEALTPLLGEKEWLRGPLSKGASYRLIVSGDVGSREIGKLIRLLEAQKLVLDDDDKESIV